MRRREFVGGAGMALVWPFEVRAQTAKIPRIGLLWFGSRGGPTPLSHGLKRALVERGYVLDGNLIIDLRYAEGKPQRYPALFAELLASGADLLLAVGNAAALVVDKRRRRFPLSQLATTSSASTTCGEFRPSRRQRDRHRRRGGRLPPEMARYPESCRAERSYGRGVGGCERDARRPEAQGRGPAFWRYPDLPVVAPAGFRRKLGCDRVRPLRRADRQRQPHAI